MLGVNQGVNKNPIENEELEVESLDNIGQIPNNSLNPDTREELTRFRQQKKYYCFKTIYSH